MISGTVNRDREATIRVRVCGPAGQDREMEAVIDTGFNGFLTLPSASIADLGLPRLGRGRAMLANGSEEIFDIFESTVIWDGQPLTVEVDAAETDALVGMSLLYEQNLQIHVVEGGTVTIEKPFS